MTWNLYCLWIVERLSGRGRRSWKYLKFIIPVESIGFFFFFLFWCPVEHILIFFPSFSPDWAITRLFGFFSPLATGDFWPLSTMCSFRHLLARVSYPSFPEGILPIRWHALLIGRCKPLLLSCFWLCCKWDLPSWLWKCFRKNVSPRGV